MGKEWEGGQEPVRGRDGGILQHQDLSPSLDHDAHVIFKRLSPHPVPQGKPLVIPTGYKKQDPAPLPRSGMGSI